MTSPHVTSAGRPGPTPARLPLSLALSTVLTARVRSGTDRHALLGVLRPTGRTTNRPLARVIPLRPPARPGGAGPDRPHAA